MSDTPSAPVGPLYTVLRSHCSECPPAELLREALTACVQPGHEFHSDGMHMNVAGVTSSAPIVDEIAAHCHAQTIISDSCMCAFGCEFEDYDGDVVNGLTVSNVMPKCGASFGNDAFKWAIYEAWRSHPEVKTYAVLIAGNDLTKRTTANDLHNQMLKLKTYWAEIDVEVIFIDVVPTQWQHR